MAARQTAPCLRCNEMIEISDAAVVIDLRLRTVGIEDGLRSPQASVSICVTCTDLMAKGDEPSQRTQPLNHIVYELVQEMVATDPSFTFLSWIDLRKGRGLSTPKMIEPKVLRAWNDFRKAMSLPMALPPTIDQPGEPSPARTLRAAV